MNRPTADRWLTRHELGDGARFFTGMLPAAQRWDAAAFEAVWRLHPETRPEIFLHGRIVAIPRWQQAYGRDYHFSGQVSAARPIPAELAPLLAWLTAEIDDRLNGLLLNWYEGPGHYIGLHRDSRRHLASGAPIVMVSFGEERRFRLARVGARAVVDFPAPHGTIFVLPYATNLTWKHGVPKSAAYSGRRISITARAFA